MLEAALIGVRLAQYVGAMVLFGASLFLLYALPRGGPAAASELRWPRPLLLASAGLALIGAAAGLIVQTAVMSGGWAEGLDPANIGLVATQMDLGRASLVRAAALVAALGALTLLRPGRRLWAVISALAAVAVVSLAWLGHGAATEGPGRLAHLASDALHLVAAAAWVGALAGFLALLWPGAAGSEARQRATHAALHGFSGWGSVIVAVLLATGLINSWYLVGLQGLGRLWTSAYGQLLLLKLALFAGMLALAAANRLRHTPALAAALEEDAPTTALSRLRRSLLLETSAGAAVLAVVAWLGTLEPPSAPALH